MPSSSPEKASPSARPTSTYPVIDHRIISEAECRIGSDDRFVKAVQCISSLIRKRKTAGDTVALDITPGKKTLVAGALLPIKYSDVDHLFYLSVQDTISAPFMMISFQTQKINEFIEQALRATHAADQRDDHSQQ